MAVLQRMFLYVDVPSFFFFELLEKTNTKKRASTCRGKARSSGGKHAPEHRTQSPLSCRPAADPVRAKARWVKVSKAHYRIGQRTLALRFKSIDLKKSGETKRRFRSTKVRTQSKKQQEKKKKGRDE
jgi:Mg-chelatase subunit ChlI